MGILLGLLIVLGLGAVYVGVFLWFGWLVSLFYNHMADKFHWVHFTFWEMAIILFLVIWVANLFRPKAPVAD